MKSTFNTLIYALLGTALAALLAFVLINLFGNLGSDFTEKMSFAFIYLSPVIILGGTVAGVIYARRRNK